MVNYRLILQIYLQLINKINMNRKFIKINEERSSRRRSD